MKILAEVNEIKENEVKKRTRQNAFTKKVKNLDKHKNKNMLTAGQQIPEYDYDLDAETIKEDEEIRVAVKRMIDDAKKV